MKTIFFEKETTLIVNEISYKFEGQSFISNDEIELIRNKEPFPYNYGGLFHYITPIKEKDYQFINNILINNNVQTCRGITIW